MNEFSNKWIFLVTLMMQSSAIAGVINLTPPTSLNIDGQNITNGIFTLESLSGFDMTFTETVILSDATSADDISHAAVIGSGSPFELLSYPGSYPLIEFGYNFDATIPDLASIGANVLSAVTDFTISLPFSSAITGFYEVIDHAGTVSWHTSAYTLDFTDSGFTNIDLFGDGSVFATFDAMDTIIPPLQFQDHGTVRTVPTPASLWLMMLGLMGIAILRKKSV